MEKSQTVIIRLRKVKISKYYRIIVLNLVKSFKASLHNQINLIKFGLTSYDTFKVEMKTIIEIFSTKKMFLV